MASLLVWSATIVYAAMMATLSLRRIERMGGGFDLAIFTQYSWLLGHGLNPFNTINGKPLLGDHVEPGLALFAPVGALHLGVNGLLVTQTLVLALVAPVLLAIARAVGAGPWLSCLMPLLWLISPLTYGPNLYEFHPEAAAPLFLALAALGLVTQRTWLFVLGVVLAISLKEDIALTVAMLGVVAVFLGRRRLGLVTAVACLIWFLVSVAVVLPAFGRSIQDEYGPRFAGGRGDALGELARWAISHPGAALADVFSISNLGLLALLVVVTAGLCLLAPLWLLVAVPALLANFASAYPPQHSIWFQYYLVPWGAAAVAAAVGLGALGRRSPRVRLTFGLVAAVVAMLSLPYSAQRIDELVTPTSGARMPDQREVRSALALARGGRPVAASGRLVAQLAQRREIYVLPFPFLGVRPGETWTRADLDQRARRVRLVIYDRNQPVTPEFAGWYRQIPRELRRLGFNVMSDSGSIVVFER